MDKKTVIISIIVIVSFAFSLVYFLNANDETKTSDQQQNNEENEKPPQRVLVYEAIGNLDDVSNSGSSGVAIAEYYDDGAYELLAEFENLADAEEGFFYEGWLVNQATSEFFSTGALELGPEGELVDNYLGARDYQSEGYDFYVLTLEPDDGDPAPADHVVEGKLVIEEN